MVRSQAMRCFDPDPNRKAWNPGRRHAWRVYGRITSPAASEVCVMFSAGRRLDRERVDGEISDSFRGQRGEVVRLVTAFHLGTSASWPAKPWVGVRLRFWDHSPALHQQWPAVPL